MTELIGWIFILIAIVVFIALIGLPIWVVIHLVKQYCKHGKLSVFQIILVVIVGIILVILIREVAVSTLSNVNENFGVNTFEESTTLPQSSSNGVIRLPPVEK